MNWFQRFFGAIDKKKGQKADVTTAEGVMIRFPGDQPEVGQPVSVIAENEDGEIEETGPAPAGEHTLPEPYNVVITTDAEGIITDIQDAQSADPDTDPIPTPEGGDSADAELRAQLSDLQTQLKAEKAAREEAERRAKILSKQPAVDPKDLGTNTPPTVDTGRGGTRDFETVKQGLIKLYQARSNRPEFEGVKFTPTGVHKFATGTGADIVDKYVEPMIEYANEMIEAVVMDYDIMQAFTAVEYPIGGNGTGTFEMPLLDHNNGGNTYLRKGKDCGFTPSGTTTIVGQNMVVSPWEHEYELCPVDTIWAQYQEGERFVNEEEVPFQALIIDFIIRRILEDWAKTVYFGQIATSPTDGIITQLKALGTQTENLVHANLIGTGVGDPLTEIDKLYDSALFTDEFDQFAETNTLIHQIYRRHHKKFTTYMWRTYNSMTSQNVDLDPSNFQAVEGTFLPLHLLKDTSIPEYYHLLSFREILYVGWSSFTNGPFKTELGREAKTKEIWFRADGHLGAGIADPTRAILGIAS